MAALVSTRPFATATSAGGLLSTFTSAFNAVTAWNEARLTRRALAQLNAHQLNDIGLTTAADIDFFITKNR